MGKPLGIWKNFQSFYRAHGSPNVAFRIFSPFWGLSCPNIFLLGDVTKIGPGLTHDIGLDCITIGIESLAGILLVFAPRAPHLALDLNWLSFLRIFVFHTRRPTRRSSPTRSICRRAPSAAAAGAAARSHCRGAGTPGSRHGIAKRLPLPERQQK